MFRNKEYVYAVYQEKSFSKAAKKLYISQPCLSAVVKKTESRLGLPLFQRSTRSLQLTEHGKRYIECVEKIMDIEKQFDRYLADVRGIKTGQIRIGANSVCSSFILPGLIRRFTDQYPEVHIELHEGNRDYLDAELRGGNLDVVLDNYPVDRESFYSVSIYTEQLFIAVPASVEYAEAFRSFRGFSAREIIDGLHLRERADGAPFKAFARAPWIILRRGNDTRNRFKALCQENDVSPEVIFEVDQMSTAFHIASSGLGLTLVSSTLVRQMPDADRLRYYPIASRHAERELFFHYPRNRYHSVALLRFMELARENFDAANELAAAGKN